MTLVVESGSVRVIGVVGGLFLATASLSGCSAPVEDLPSDAPVATYEWDAGADRMQALLEGTLAIEDGCLYVISREGDLTLPVFPRDYVRWDPETETLSYGDSDYVMGDAIWAGGGWVDPPESASIPGACEPDEWGDVMLIQDESLEQLSGRDS